MDEEHIRQIARIRDLKEERPELSDDWTDYVAISEIETFLAVG